MGAFGALGELAGSFNQAAELDRRREFEAEIDRRRQIGGILEKIITDETAYPQSRNAAIQAYIDMHGPITGAKPPKVDFNKILAPAQPPQQMASYQPPAPPPMTGNAPQDIAASAQGSPVALMSPPQPPGVFMSPEEVTRMAAGRAGAITGAQAGAQAKFPVVSENPDTGALQQQMLSGTGEHIGATIQNVWNPMIMRLQLQGLHPVVYKGTQGEPLPGFQSKIRDANGRFPILDQNGQEVPDAEVFSAAQLPSTMNERMNPKGEVTRTRKRSLQPPVAGGTAQPTPQQQLQAPTPPPDVTMGAAQAAGAPLPQAETAPAAAQALTQPAAGKVKEPKSTAHVTKGSLDWKGQNDPVSLAAIRWATQGQTPKGGPMAERQVLSRLRQMGMEPALPVPPALQKSIQESFVARNSAIGLIDDIMKNSRVLDSLISAGKIQVAANPKTGAGIMTRAANLTAQEAKVAGDFGQLVEHANLLRGPLGATGFRGEQAWEALQAQRGNIMGDPRITRQMLTGMRERLVGLNNADKMVLGGQGLSSAQADPYEGRTATGPNGHKIVRKGGQWVDATSGQSIQ